MIRTKLCDLLEIDYPIIQAGMGPATSARLAATVSNAGGLGSLGAFLREPSDFLDELAKLQSLTNRSFALNHVVPTLTEETFAAVLKARPKVLSFALADPQDLVGRADDVGSFVMHQVTTVRQAIEAAERGVDIIIAQGGEAGGYGGTVATLPLVPQIVDAVAPLPVVAAGGIFDGRGVAAALALGAVGVNIGTRFLATEEAPFEEWKGPILEAASEDAVKVDFLNDVMPVPGTIGYGTVMRAIKTAIARKWMEDDEGVRSNPDQVVTSITGANRGNLPASGQSAVGVSDIVPAGEAACSRGQSNFTKSAADTDVARVRKLIKKLGAELLQDPEIGGLFLDKLKYQRIHHMDDTAMLVRVKFMAKPDDKFALRPIIYAKIAELFQQEGIRFAPREVQVRIADSVGPSEEHSAAAGERKAEESAAQTAR